MVLNVHRNLIRDGDKGGKREIIYQSLHCLRQNDTCIKMDSDESHFNVSVGSDGQSHKTVSTDHNLFEGCTSGGVYVPCIYALAR